MGRPGMKERPGRRKGPQPTYEGPRRICLVCGKEIPVSQQRTTCSHECRVVLNLRSPGSVDSRGYRCLSKSCAEQVYGADTVAKIAPMFFNRFGRPAPTRLEHRIVMAIHLGRPLLAEEVVHHRDGNRLNNAIGNLLVMKEDEHITMHEQARRVADSAVADLANKRKQIADLTSAVCSLLLMAA